MIDPILLQIHIGLFGVLAIVALGFNRMFLGSILATIGQSVWIWVAYTTGQWGAVVVLCLSTLIYLLAVIARWPRKPPLVKVENDEQDWLGI